MTKPRVISKAAMRRAKRQGIHYASNGQGCGVDLWIRNRSHNKLTPTAYLYAPIGRGGRMFLDEGEELWARYVSDVLMPEMYANRGY